jgi:hypothetical protein
MAKPDTKPSGTVRELNKRGMSLLTEKRDIQTIRKFFGNPRWFDFKGCYVRIKGNSYVDVYCFNDEAPRDDTVVYKVFNK